MDPVVHFELPYEDRNRAADFYEKAFGWRMQKLGPEMGDYMTAQTAEMDEATNRPKTPGNIGGGLFKRTKPDQYPSVVVAVKDINEAMKKVKEAGGQVLGGSKGPDQPDDIPGVGLYVAVLDSEGNRIGVLEPRGM